MSTPLAAHERMELARKLMQMEREGVITSSDLVTRFSQQIDTDDAQAAGAVPVPSIYPDASDLAYLLASKGTLNPLSRKASDVLSTTVDTVNITSQNVLARIDLEPVIYNFFVHRFPGLDRIPKERSNGVSHTYDLSTGYDSTSSDSAFITELGTAPIGQGTYAQATSPIGVLATTRGASYKQQLAVAQSGMQYDGGMDVVDLELQRGAWSMAAAAQKCLYQGTLVGSKTGTDEYGTTSANGFTGLRQQLGPNSVSGTYPSGFNPVKVDKDTNTITQAIDSAAQQIVDNGGEPTAVHLSAYAARALAIEGGNLIRYNSADVNGGMVLGNRVRAIDTVAGELPLIVVPGTAIGTYTAGSDSVYNGSTVEDVYVLDETSMSFPFLGSATPSVLEIPMGVNLALTKRYILFWLFGFALKVPIFSGKVRLPH